MFITSKLVSFIFLVGFSVTVLWSMSKAKEKLPSIRRIVALEAIEEAVGRATELGRPVHYTTGIGAVTDEFAPQTMAGLQVLQYTARLCAERDCQIICTVMPPLVYPLAQERVKQGYAEAGRLDAYREDSVRFMAPVQFAYAASTMDLIRREQVAANIEIGAFYAEALLIAEAAATVGALQIGGTARMYQLQYFVIACDYVLIGEEMFAADAYLTREPTALGALKAQDYGKVLCMLLLVVGAVLQTFDITFIRDVLVRYGN